MGGARPAGSAAENRPPWRSATRRFLLLEIAVALVTLVTPAIAGEASPHGPNVRPFFTAGYSEPIEFGQLGSGFGLGAGLELESSRHWSVLFRFDYHVLQPDPDNRYRLGYYVGPDEFSASSWSIAARGYLTRGGLRPYVELSYGIRLGGGRYDRYWAVPHVQGYDVAYMDGMIGAARFGFSTARYGRAGVHLEAGYEGILRNPDRFAIVPVRLGIVFPLSGPLRSPEDVAAIEPS